MRLMRKVFIMALLLLGAVTSAAYAAGSPDWIWISSDSRYSKYYAPANIKVLQRVQISGGRTVATSIGAQIKTTYSYGGAQETIANYGIQAVIPDPAKLAYSLAEVEINPQNRTIEYDKEDFYDADGNVIWSKVYDKHTVKEINSRSFDEDFYTAIVDDVFRYGETERRTAKDRWLTLWTAKSADGAETTAIADTTTMRLKGDNIIFWEWVELKDASSNVQEVKFMKKALNLVEGTQRVVNCQYWDASGWKDITGEIDGRYMAIKAGSYEEKGLKRLRAYAGGYQYWLNRYSLEK